MNKITKKVGLFIIGCLIIFLIICCFIIAKNMENSIINYMGQGEQINNQVLTYLNSKYNENFEIIQLTKEVDGNDGIYYRVVVKSKKRDDKGVVYCYFDDSAEGTKIEVGGENYVFTDDYAEIIFAEEYANQLQALLGDDVLVKCQLYVTNHMLTEDEFVSGLKNCLENPELNSRLYVFVLADIDRVGDGLRESVEHFMSQYNADNQYLYAGYQTNMDMENWEELYYENQSSFERYLVDKSDAELVEFSSFARDVGYKGNKVVKD